MQACELLFSNLRVESSWLNRLRSNIEQILFDQLDLWKIVNGTDMMKPSETPDNVEVRKIWKTKVVNVIYILQINIDENIFQHIQNIEELKEVWDSITTLHSKTNEAQL